MTTPTYSVATTGYVVGGNNLGPKFEIIPDTSSSGYAAASPASVTNQGAQYVMSRNDPILCKGTDGALHWYRLDPERSTPANPVLVFLGP